MIARGKQLTDATLHPDKCTHRPPKNASFVSCANAPPDYYLWPIGQAGKLLRKEIPYYTQIPNRDITQR